MTLEEDTSEMWDIGFLHHGGEYRRRPDEGRHNREHKWPKSRQTYSRLPEIRKVDGRGSLQVSNNVRHSLSSNSSCFL